jgi:copper chaperone CopZ
MTPKERMKAYLSGEPFDRIPCGLMLSDHAARVLGCSVREYQLSAEVMAQEQIAAWRRYGHDGINVGVGLTGIAEVLGSGVTFPENGAPYIKCGGCAEKLETTLKEVSGVKCASVKADEKTVTVNFDAGTTSEAQLLEVLGKAGFAVA